MSYADQTAVAVTPTKTAPSAARVAAPWVELGRDIKLSHTVFALPFALLATFLAAGWAGRRPALTELMLILLCMVTARTFAMAVNRLMDAAIDAQNPRTAGRAVPSGRLGWGFMVWVIVGAAGVFTLGAAGFWVTHGNHWPLVLSPAVLAVLAMYSVTKRFTWFCHLFLGVALAVSPLAAAVAIEPGFLAWPVPWLIAVTVVCWVAGFDVIYALQDVDFDRSMGLFSMPASLGPVKALWISRGLHAMVVVLLVLCGAISRQLGVGFDTACGLVAVLLIVEHALVWRSATNHLEVAFFTVNGVISVVLGLAGIVDVLAG